MSSISAIPVFKLYGELTAWPTPDLVHCESIAERSNLHNWEIKPHRHIDLVQILYVKKGAAHLRLEDKADVVTHPIILVVPSLCIHTFSFSTDIEGYILTFASPLLQVLPAGLMDDFLRAGQLPVGADGDYLDWIFHLISTEHQQNQVAREPVLHSLLTLLIAWVTRQAGLKERAAVAPAERGVEYLQAFTTLVDQHFREHWSIARYASQIGINSNRLNLICRNHAGQSALQIINERLLLESKRCLTYTDMTISEVSDSLGFSEPAYFSRFFKKIYGISPRDYRGSRKRECSG